MAKVVKVTVRWTTEELHAVGAVLRAHPIFPGRKAALEAVAKASKTLNAAESAGKKKRTFRRLPELSFTQAHAGQIIEVLARSDIVVVRRAAAQLEKQRRRTALRGHASGPNPHSLSRKKRVARGDAGDFR